MSDEHSLSQNMSSTPDITKERPRGPLVRNKSQKFEWEDRLIGRRLVYGPDYRLFGISQRLKDIQTRADIRARRRARDSIATSTASSQPLQSQFPFIKLPAELRNMVLRELFGGIESGDWGRKKDTTPASIIFTCKQMYNEGRIIARGGCTFRLDGIKELGPYSEILAGSGVRYDLQSERCVFRQYTMIDSLTLPA